MHSNKDNILYKLSSLTKLQSTGKDTRKQNYQLNKLRKKLRNSIGKAITDYDMINENDRIMVCLSGGADSYTMLDILHTLQQSAPIPFSLHVVVLDQKQPNFDKGVLENHLQAMKINYTILEQDTYSVVKRVIPEEKTMCSLCSRLRRGILYSYAHKHGFDKIALGHHRDDIIETLFLNLFFGGVMKTMPAKLISDDKNNVVIRPMAYCKESDIKQYATGRGFPITPCSLCGSNPNSQRKQIKHMLQSWEKTYPGRIENIFRAMQHITPSHLLDIKLHDFLATKKEPRQTISITAPTVPPTTFE